jgi:hypothetical protein
MHQPALRPNAGKKKIKKLENIFLSVGKSRPN